MIQQSFRRLALITVAASAGLAAACGQDTSAMARQGAAPQPEAAAVHDASHPAHSPATATVTLAAAVPATTAAPAAATKAGGLSFSGTREETETFIRYHQTIRLTPEQERIKVEALSSIPAPCCANNPLATCCCPCNMAKAAWGLSAWLITAKGYGVEQVNQAAKDWLAAANPDGFSGDACYSGGCARAIHQNGCGGMDDRRVL